MKHPNRDLFKEAQRQGWEITHRKGGHMCLRYTLNPTVAMVFTPATPTRDPRARLNLITQLRRSGFFVWNGR